MVYVTFENFYLDDKTKDLKYDYHVSLNTKLQMENPDPEPTGGASLQCPSSVLYWKSLS